MSPAWELIRAVALAIGIMWAAGSVVILFLRPWRYLDREDRWLGYALPAGWLLIFGWMAIELALEFHLDGKDARRARLR